MLTHYKKFTLATLLAALTACSASAPPVTPASATSDVQSVTLPSGEHVVRADGRIIRFGGPRGRTGSARGWIEPQTNSNKLLYGSSYDGDFINIYSQHGTGQSPIGQLTSDLTSPQGMVVDKHHQLWVANTNAYNVVAFKRGATTPFTTLNDAGYYPISVAVNSKGTVFAANAEGTSGPPGNVTFWKKGQTSPSGTLTFPRFLLVLGIGIDASDNVYVSFVPTSGPPAVVEFPAGSQTGQGLALNASISDITFDSSNDLVMEDESGGLGIWAYPYSGDPTRTIDAFGNEPTFNKSESDVWIAYANYSNPMIEGYDYSTGTQIDTITSGFSDTAIPYGVALDPPAKL
jgi:hypothetical protein